jgi:trigger factor
MGSIVSVNAEKIEKNTVELIITVKAERFTDAVNQVANKLANEKDIRGFHKGENIPHHLINKAVNAEELYLLAIEDLLVDVYQEAVKESGCEPVNDPKDIDIIQVEDGKDFIFQAKIEVKPEVVLGAYKNLEIPKKTATVGSIQIDEELKRLQNKHAEILLFDEGAFVEHGDTVVVDFEGFTDQNESPEMKGEKCELVIGSGYFIPKFEDQLIGIKAGQKTEIRLTLPTQNINGEQVTKQVTFNLNVRQIKRKISAPIDDEFAKTYSEYDTLNALKKGIKDSLLREAEQKIENEYRNAIVKKAVEHAILEVPDVMTKKRFEKISQQFHQNLQHSGIKTDDYFRNMKTTENAFVEQMKKQAEDSTRAELVLEKIARVEGITITDDDFNAEIKKIAEEYQQSPSSILKIMGQLGQNEFRQNMLNERVINFLVDHNP